ncbi:hypothetical protein GUJ93_ZPchr0013g33796 [Zizania palustris]|uniref:Uncharacterized protein n=1 Tax=Zizania palustris TaxID=103762 RepID=A0A8J5WS36_ZIZPA|nr:hypothetical protein GUJ93_ZPchr0013g33796 [Zizania palustris]
MMRPGSQVAFISLAPLLEHPYPVGKKHAGSDGNAPGQKRKRKEVCSSLAKKAKKWAVTPPNYHATQSAAESEATQRQA